MIKTTNARYLLIIVFALGCETRDKAVNLNGHWHCYPSGYGDFETLDIGDSLTITNAYRISGGERTKVPGKNRFGQLVLPLDYYRTSGIFSLVKDTLTIMDTVYRYKYVRSDLATCRLDDRYSNSTVNISLTVVESAEPFDSSSQKLRSEDLFIGRSKDQTFSVLFPDSLFIQTRDVYIELKDIPTLCRLLKEIGWAQKMTNINFHADSAISREFLGKIVNLIPDTIEIHRVVRIKNQDIGLQRIR